MGTLYKRSTISITHFQSKMLEKEKERTGNSVASIIRRAISDHIWKDL